MVTAGLLVVGLCVTMASTLAVFKWLDDPNDKAPWPWRALFFGLLGASLFAAGAALLLRWLVERPGVTPW